MSIEWSDEQLQDVGIDKHELNVLLRHLKHVQKKLVKMNLSLYVGMEVAIIHDSIPTHSFDGQKSYSENVVASIQMKADGGDW
jgi:hypothetical protein